MKRERRKKDRNKLGRSEMRGRIKKREKKIDRTKLITLYRK